MRLTESLASRPALADLIRNAEKLDESKLIVINEIVQEFCKNNNNK